MFSVFFAFRFFPTPFARRRRRVWKKKLFIGAGPRPKTWYRRSRLAAATSLSISLRRRVFIVAKNKIANRPCNRALKNGFSAEGLRPNDTRATAYLN